MEVMQENLWQYLALVTQLGLFVIICILAGIFLGLFLDKIFHLKYIFTLIFLIFGLIAAFLGSAKLLKLK
jgi:F0F1-type ATP synthase assembly protein I